MSVTVALQTYFGVEAPRAAFWVHTSENLVCGSDLNHAIIPGANFCPVCGNATKTISIEAPSPQFTEVAKKAGLEPLEFWNILCGNSEHGWEWEDDGRGGSGQTFRLFRFNVEAYIEGAHILDEVERISALGFRLDDVAHSSWNRERPHVSAVSWGELKVYDRAMREVAKIFGVVGEPKLYSQVYYG